jgi:hypothetical protein
MRRLTASRAWASSAFVAATVAALAVMFPGLGFGQPTTSHGGPPSEVFMQNTPGVCLTDGSPMAQELTLAEASHLLVYFTGEWSGLGVNETGFMWFRLDGTDTNLDWQFAGHSLPETTGTVMWTFEDVAAGPHNVSAQALVRAANPNSDQETGREGAADLDHCAFTVFVIPVAP